MSETGRVLQPRTRRPDRGVGRASMAETHRRPATMTRFCSVADRAVSDMLPLRRLVELKGRSYVKVTFAICGILLSLSVSTGSSLFAVICDQVPGVPATRRKRSASEPRRR